MYSSYTTLQRVQLAKQEYLDTQEVFLGVYAPGRNAALKASLQDQLHRKFLLTDSLRPEALGSAVGVLLVREDLFLMPTALSCFADALRSGADYVTSDAVFGYSGVTTLYHSQGFAACPGCALVSRELLRRCQAEARDPENPVELLTLAAKLRRSHVCLPLALAHYERDICAEDVWSVKGKRVFIMSHLLDMTGAPIVLVSAVPVLRSMGYEVVVLGPEDGGSMPLFLEAGATVITRKGCVQSPLLWGLALCADLVLANTVVEARAVRALSGARVPVLWWLHDAFAGYPHIAHQIPRELGKNIRLYSVGSHAANAMHSVRPEFNIRPLIYGLPDYAAEKFSHYDLSYAGGRPLFATVGSFENRKGQDIFCKAIRLLPPETMKKASFLFVGKAAEAEMMDAVRSLTAQEAVGARHLFEHKGEILTSHLRIRGPLSLGFTNNCSSSLLHGFGQLRDIIQNRIDGLKLHLRLNAAGGSGRYSHFFNPAAKHCAGFARKEPSAAAEFSFLRNDVEG